MVRLLLQWSKKKWYLPYFDLTLLGSNELKIIQEFFALSKVDHSHGDYVKKII